MTIWTVASITATIHAAIPEPPSVHECQLWTRGAQQSYDLGDWFYRQIEWESEGFQYDCVNKYSLCYGLGQLNPRFYPLEDYANPVANVVKAASLMRGYYDKYGTLPKALAAYNWGPGNMDNLLAAHPFTWQTYLPHEPTLYLKMILGDDAKEAQAPMKLSWHLINRPDNIVDIINAHPPAYVKLLNPPPVNPFPNSKVIGRAWIGGDAIEQDYITRYDSGGYLARWRAVREAAPYVWAWELVNEPPVATKEQRQRLNDFLCSCEARLPFHAIVGGNLSVGWPDKPHDILDLQDAVRACDYWGVHEYGWLPEPSFYPYHLTRYRTHILAPLRQLGIVPKLLIGECGMDGGVAGKPQQGWKRSGLSAEQYWAYLQRYAAELAMDPEVLAAFVFTSGPTPDWSTFDVDATLSGWLSAAIGAQPSQTLEQAIVEEAQRQVMPYTPTFGLWKELVLRALVPQSDEFAVEHGGVKYVARVGRDLDLEGGLLPGQRIAYCRDGDWANVKVVEADNE